MSRETCNLVVSGVNFLFYNKSGRNRSGFFHESELFMDGSHISTARAQYYNRTWESYEFQSCMKDAVYNAISAEKSKLVTQFKRLNGKSRMKAEEKGALWSRSSYIQLFEELNKALDNDPNRAAHEAPFKALAMVAAMGDILCESQTDRNAWKKRMIAAGLPEGSVHFPEDWDSLSEDEKQRRLDGAVAALAK